MKRKICIVTGSRAEFGVLSGLMQCIKEDEDLVLQIIATNMHLSPEFDLTYKEIEAAGFVISKKVEMLLSSDTATGIAKSVGLAFIGFADAYEDIKPDIIIVLGDRYEILAAVSTALFFKIPVVHISGGDITEGLIDEAIRHSITKMSHLHFTSTEEYRRRVIQLGEFPESVFNVGALGVENIRKMKFWNKKQLENDLKFQLAEINFLVTFHPVTLESNTAKKQFSELLDALSKFNYAKIIFTKSNSDTDGRIINSMIDEYVAFHSNCVAFSSLGQLRYLSIMSLTQVVIGNSSSGIIETPSFGIPTLNIGDRQKGRVQATSVFNVSPDAEEIYSALIKLVNERSSQKILATKNPYEKKGTSIEIIRILKEKLAGNIILKKSFYNIEFKI